MPKKSVKKAAKSTTNTEVTKKSGRGGVRAGAGRPVGTGKFGAPTKAVRVPIHMVDKVIDFIYKEINVEKKVKK